MGDPKGIGVLVGVALYFMWYFLASDPPPEITFQEVVNDFLRYGYIERLQVVNKQVGEQISDVRFRVPRL